MKCVRYLALAPLALVAACGSGATDPAATLQTVKDTETTQLQSLAAKDLDGVVRHYGDNAVVLLPGAPPAEGTAAIREALAGLAKDPNLDVRIDQGPGWAAASGDLAVTTSTGTMTVTDATTGNAATVPMRNQTVWQKAPGDNWKIVSEVTVDMTPASTGEAAEAAE